MKSSTPFSAMSLPTYRKRGLPSGQGQKENLPRLTPTPSVSTARPSSTRFRETKYPISSLFTKKHASTPERATLYSATRTALKTDAFDPPLEANTLPSPSTEAKRRRTPESLAARHPYTFAFAMYVKTTSGRSRKKTCLRARSVRRSSEGLVPVREIGYAS